MPRYEVPWPWKPQEEIVAVWFLSRGIEVPDVARIMTHRLRSPPRDKRNITLYMDRFFNPSLARQGYRQVCTPGMLDWDKDAVDDFIIRMTPYRYRLDDLLRFRNEDNWLLVEYHRLNVPLREVFSVTGMQGELDSCLGKHRMSWGDPPRRGGRRFF